MKFEEEYPSFEGDNRWCPASIADPHSDSSCYWAENAIKEHTIDKQLVKEAFDDIDKHTIEKKRVREALIKQEQQLKCRLTVLREELNLED